MFLSVFDSCVQCIALSIAVQRAIRFATLLYEWFPFEPYIQSTILFNRLHCIKHCIAMQKTMYYITVWSDLLYNMSLTIIYSYVQCIHLSWNCNAKYNAIHCIRNINVFFNNKRIVDTRWDSDMSISLCCFNLV